MKIRKVIEKTNLATERWNTLGEQYMEMAVQRGECMLPSYSKSRHASLDSDKMACNRCIGIFHSSPYLGAYKVLRARIRGLMQVKGWKTIMITSPMPGEGKTLTAVNLALTYAKEFDQTVLLVDCDFHQQDVHKYMGINSDKGLVDYLVHETPLSDIIVWPGISKMTLISGGTTVRESTEIIGSARMRGLVEGVKGRYPDRIVIFDTPPVLTGADAIVFAAQVDSIVMVIEHGKTSQKDVSKALELIPKEKFLGFILNRDIDCRNNSD